jgi:hypothetical protein
LYYAKPDVDSGGAESAKLLLNVNSEAGVGQPPKK